MGKEEEKKGGEKERTEGDEREGTGRRGTGRMDGDNEVGHDRPHSVRRLRRGQGGRSEVTDVSLYFAQVKGMRRVRIL